MDLGIGGFEHPEEIGRGGYSVVYRAWQPAFQRWVAIKVVTGTLDSRALERFERECAAIGMLSGHPNIVTVHDSGGTSRGEPYIVMELLTGSLAQQLTGHRMQWRDAVSTTIKLAGALEAAHRAGVVHRDVKPENVLVSQYGDVKLGDFGIARLDGFGETRTGVVTASILHAAPEVLDGRRPSVASDVYSLGSTLYFLLAGRPPFLKAPEESSLALYKRIATEPPPPLPSDVPPAVADILLHALAKDPAERPASAAAFGEALRAVSDAAEANTGAPTRVVSNPYDVPTADVPDASDAGPEPAVTAPSPPPARRPRRAALAGGIAAAVVVAVALVAILASGGGSKDKASSSSSTTATSAAVTTTIVAPTTTAGASNGASGGGTTATTIAGGVRLGVDLKPITSEPCRAPTIAAGAEWQVRDLQLGGRTFPASYFCNMFAGGTGSLDFVLGGQYHVLRMTLGFSDQAATSHTVRYEMIGDGTTNLIDPITLRFGQVRDLNLDVSGITRLRIRITELSPAGGSESPSQPALGAPTLLVA